MKVTKRKLYFFNDIDLRLLRDRLADKLIDSPYAVTSADQLLLVQEEIKRRLSKSQLTN